jgi:hypothetical protein
VVVGFELRASHLRDRCLPYPLNHTFTPFALVILGDSTLLFAPADLDHDVRVCVWCGVVWCGVVWCGVVCVYYCGLSSGPYASYSGNSIACATLSLAPLCQPNPPILYLARTTRVQHHAYYFPIEIES